MKTAKLFKNGRSQAVRLPKAFRFRGKEVYIKKTPIGILLLPKDSSIWEDWIVNLNKFEGSFTMERNQPTDNEKRAGLDEIFN